MHRKILAFGFAFLAIYIPNISFSNTIQVGVGLSLPPYVLSNENKGIEIDIVKEVLVNAGYKVEFVYLPFHKVPKALSRNEVDAAITINESSGIKDVFYSDSHITYQNVAIGLQSNKFTVKNIDDLSQYRVVAFQNATKYLGEKFHSMAKNNKGYTEKSKQELQVSMLYGKRTQLVVLDINIFKYYRNKESKLNTALPIDVFEIFPPTHYKLAFINKDYVDVFNKGLKNIKGSGRYKEIIESYVGN